MLVVDWKYWIQVTFFCWVKRNKSPNVLDSVQQTSVYYQVIPPCRGIFSCLLLAAGVYCYVNEEEVEDVLTG